MNFQGLFETDLKTYNGSATGTPLAEVQTCYNGAARPCTGTSITFPISQRSVYNSLPLGSSWLVSEKNFLYNTYGLVTEEDDFDYGTNNPGGLLRKTLVQYASLGNNILDQPSSITVQNASGGTVAQTAYNYDASGDMLSETAGGLTKSFTYNSNGAVATTTDVNNAQTSFTYGSDSCNGAFPTSVSLPLSLSESFTWNCNGGVVTSVTDETGGTTTITYSDPDFWRPNAVTDPMNNQRGFTYQPNPSYASPFMVASSLTFNGGSSIESDVKYEDGFGRPFVDQKQESPGSSTLDTVSYNFDANGRLASVSTPCAVSYVVRCSTPQTTYAYDALNRPLQITDGGGGYTSYSYSGNDVYDTTGPAPSGENAKRRQLQFDGLGRLTSVCEVTGLTGSGTCSQTSAQTGYWTEYSYDALGDLAGVVQNAQSGSTQSRSYSFDGLGRMTSETEAESGITTYVYDSDSTCGNYPGDLVKRVDAAGNVTCYSYDALHRVTSITYPSGPNSANTPGRYFAYDNTCCGWNLSNTKGRLWGAHTCFSPCSSLLTDEVFSFDARGDVTTAYEFTPNSGGYYTVSASYWANGALETLSGPGFPQINYGVDGEGRPYSVGAGSGQNPVSSTTYNPASEVLGVAFGSGDSDSYQYDSNTGRMTNYTFSVNGQSVVGNLAWNADGTLASLGITDPFDSSNTQNCSYNYDDLARIASGNCGSIWSQTFSYDAFGNIEKSGSMSFMPAYSSSTNQMTSIGNFTPTYDSDGNVTDDGLNSYAWDANGKPTTVNGVTVTYDAFGRQVERDQGGYITQAVYSPTGFLMQIMNGQTMEFSFVPLPGGGLAEYHTNGYVEYRHADWLGSDRLISDQYRAMTYDGAYAPFGESYAESGSTQRTFTGQIQTITDNVYDFPFREYGIQGRWPSPDPLGPGAFNLADPQSLDRYAYVRNNPAGLVDPLGLVNIPGYRSLVDDYAGLGGGVQFGSNWNEFDLFQIPVTSGGLVWALAPTLLSNTSPLYFSNAYGNWEQSLIFIEPGFQLGAADLGSGFDLFGNSLGTSWPYPTGAALRPSPAPQPVYHNLFEAVAGGVNMAGHVIPAPCGGGGFLYGGPFAKAGGAEGAFQGLYEWDSNTGASSGWLAEGSYGEAGGGAIHMNGSTLPFVFIGEPVGAIASRSWVGVYGGTSTFGVGAYVDITSAAACH